MVNYVDLDFPIKQLSLSNRAMSCLLRNGIETLGQLTKKTERDLLLIKNFGEGCMKEVKNELARYAIGLKRGPKIKGRWILFAPQELFQNEHSCRYFEKLISNGIIILPQGLTEEMNLEKENISPETQVKILPLSIREKNRLENQNIFTLGQLIEEARRE